MTPSVFAPTCEGGQPCIWPISYLTCHDCPTLTPDDKTALEAAAVQYLWNWTGRAFGLCVLQDVRPCFGCTITSTFGHGTYSPHPGSTLYYPGLFTACGLCGRSKCTCSMTSSVALPGPVDSVERVTVDGSVLHPSAWIVYDERFLVRTDGGEWPRCQDLSLPSSEVGTWSVSYTRGQPVPTPGQIATGMLVCELAKAACGSASCQLPRRLQSITRQGITAQMVDDPFEGLEKGLTGVWLIDSWVTSVMRAPLGGRVRSVDVAPSTRRSGSWR